MSKVEHPVMLIVMDGWGYSENPKSNAIHAAKKPNWDALLAQYPHDLIRCSGDDVGLPAGQMGNSEVGHMHLGSGRTINQDFTRISKAIEDQSFFENQTFKRTFEKCASTGNACHILGLVSPGGVHSHEEHIHALIAFAARSGVNKICLHAFLDGRDTPPRSAEASLEQLHAVCSKHSGARIASVVGRYLAMDRNQNWDRTEQAYDLIVDGKANFSADTAMAALNDAYARDEDDEFVQTTSIRGDDGVTAQVADGDCIVFANFRSDRARQLTQALTARGFEAFERKRVVALSSFVTMTSYSEQFDCPVAFPPIELKNTFGDWIANQGLKQLRIAETEKYAHVTFFFNGGVEAVAPGEDRTLIDSPNVATYDLQPEMSAPQVTDALVAAIDSRNYDAIICNYANADMVGHTGNFDAAVRCIEALDECLGRVVAAATHHGMEILITADHGNAEQMCAYDVASGSEQAHTAHTSNLVPLVYVGRHADVISGGCLSDIAPTMLALMGLPQPGEMTGRSLVTLATAKMAAG